MNNGENKTFNLLFIYTDEQAFDTLAAYGNHQIEMPNLNKLAERSFVFEKTYVTQPVCTPSRSSLLTGLYPHTNNCTKNNIPLSPDIKCLPEMLENGIYETAHFGKWHLGDELFAQHGFKNWISIEDSYNYFFREGLDKTETSDYNKFLINKGYTSKGRTFGRGESARFPEEVSKPAFLAEKSIEFIEDNVDNSFVLYVNFLEPHMPFFGPRDDQYNPSDIPLPDNFKNEPTESQPLKTRLYKEGYLKNGHSGMPLKTEKDWQKMKANYWGLCSLVDTYVGKILDSLEDNDLMGNTIIVFTSDHGDMMGSHRLLAKCTMFEEAVRVPFLLTLPAQKKKITVEYPVSQIDIVPTLLDLMNQTIPENLQGNSLKPQLIENSSCERDVVIEWNGPNSGIIGEGKGDFNIPPSMKDKITNHEAKQTVTDPVRTIITPDGWKLNLSTIDESELYNLNEDSGETCNLYGKDGYKTIVDRLTKKIMNWQIETSQ